MATFKNLRSTYFQYLREWAEEKERKEDDYSSPLSYDQWLEEGGRPKEIPTPEAVIAGAAPFVCQETMAEWDNEKGKFRWEFYPCYDDRLSDAEVCQILESADPASVFNEIIFDVYDNAMENAVDEICCAIHKWMDRNLVSRIAGDEDLRDGIDTWVQENTTFVFPYEHYFRQEYNAVITMDTGDAKMDYVENYRVPAWNGLEGAIPPHTGIAFLARSQGYSEADLQHALEQGDIADPHGFLESMRSEMANCSSQCVAVTLLVKMTLEQMIHVCEGVNTAKLNPEAGIKLVFDKGTTVGLFDGFNGAGGPFEIELEKDLIIPAQFLHSVLPDCKRNARYTVQEVYGMCGSAWKDTFRDNPANNKCSGLF